MKPELDDYNNYAHSQIPISLLRRRVEDTNHVNSHKETVTFINFVQ